MKIGFAGNQKEMTKNQKDTFLRIMRKFKHNYRDIDFHMGNAPGCDSDAYRIIIDNELVSQLTFYPYRDHGDPSFEPDDERELARKEIRLALVDKPTVFERNRAIIDACDVLVAVPKEDREQKESETWMAIRYSKLKSKRVFIIYPEGKATKWPAR